MGYSIGYDARRDRYIGYGVPAICEHPPCNEKIDRGMSYACESCGLFFCPNHLHLGEEEWQCQRCLRGEEPFDQKPEHEEWVRFMLIDKSWKEWRKNNPKKVQEMRESLKNQNAPK